MANTLTERFQNIHEFVAAARIELDGNIWDYLVGGSETETTLRRNRAALDGLALQAFVLNDVSQVRADTSFLGNVLRLPIALAPVSSLASFHEDGALLAATAASEFRVPIFLNALNRPGLEAFKDVPGGQKFLQIYAAGGPEWILRIVGAARSHGFDGLAITVDNAVGSRRERDIAKRFVKEWAVDTPVVYERERPLAALTWSDIESVISRTDFPVILKGIATAEDARRAADIGVAAVYVSNHGGRQLDHGRGTTEILPEVVSAIDSRVPVIVDGGFSRGTDIIKAVALGADLVVIGRLYLYALAAAGGPGIVRLLEILEDEITRGLALVGRSSLDLLSPNLVVGSTSVSAPSVHSPFPLLDLPY